MLPSIAGSAAIQSSSPGWPGARQQHPCRRQGRDFSKGRGTYRAPGEAVPGSRGKERPWGFASSPPHLPWCLSQHRRQSSPSPPWLSLSCTSTEMCMRLVRCPKMRAQPPAERLKDNENPIPRKEQAALRSAGFRESERRSRWSKESSCAGAGQEQHQLPPQGSRR